MKTFEYEEIEPPQRGFPNREHLLDLLNKMGKDGWELVHFGDVIMIFKREIS